MSDVDSKLAMLRVQLFMAMQTLKGDDQLKFKQLLFDTCQCMDGAAEFQERLRNYRPYVEEPR